MNRFLITLCISLFATLSAHSQIIDPDTYKWDSLPVKIPVEKQFAEASAVVLKDVRLYNFYYDHSKTKDNLTLEELHHKVVQINDTRAIEVYNRLYIPISGVIEIMDIRARTVAPDGKITELNKYKIKELDNKEGEGAYKIFAFEGLEKGSRLEYLFKLKKEADYSFRNNIQSTEPVQLHQMEIINPENLKFDYKTYNGKSAVLDTLIGEKRYVLLTSKDVPGKDEEKYSLYSAELMRHEIQLAYNSASGKSRILSYNSAVQRTYPVFFEQDQKALKKIEKISSQLGLSKMDLKDKVRTIENYIKTNIQEMKSSEPDFYDATKILQTKLANSTGRIKLYVQFCLANGINCQVVYTTDRSKLGFDANFESWNYLSETILYFPDLDEYVDPSDITSRYPLISSLYTLNNGLFMEEVTVGKFKSATSSIKKIKAQDVSKNGEVIDATCKFNKTMDSIDITFNRSFNGILASPYRFVFNYAQKEDKKKQLDEMMKFSMTDARVVSDEVKNTEFLDADKPLETFGEVIGASLLEKTGKDVIFKIGDVIGPQSELYQEKARVSDIDMLYAHSYKRTIRLEVPAGYKLSGLDAIKMNIKFDYEGKDACGFISDYTLAGNMLTINIREYYNVIQLPKEQFENFRKVINAAADFNKINVVLEKI